ncbi:MAG: MFS transporter [Pseudomonadota bacterium]
MSSSQVSAREPIPSKPAKSWLTLIRLGDPVHRNVLLLAGAQGLANTCLAMVMLTTALVGFSLAVDKSLATLPLSVHFLAMLATSAPAALLMGRIGRRSGLIIGSLAGIVGGLLQFQAVMQANFWLLTIGAIPLGMFAAFVQHYRFAAADIADKDFKPRAISLCLAGGTIGAFFGPEIAKVSRGWFDPVLYAGIYLAIAIMAAATITLLAFLKIPLPKKSADTGQTRPLFEILRQPAAIGAIAAGAIGFGVMTLLMTSTPLAMRSDGHSFDDSAFVIQWHALAMYAPSFFTGSLIGRFGVRTIIFAGVGLNVACLVLSLLGSGVVDYWLALFCLGIGWNFMFVGGSSLLTECYSEAERPKAQAANDFIVFSVVAFGSFSSGFLFNEIGWSAVNLAMVPALLIAAIAVALSYRRGPRLAIN